MSFFRKFGDFFYDSIEELPDARMEELIMKMMQRQVSQSRLEHEQFPYLEKPEKEKDIFIALDIIG